MSPTKVEQRLIAVTYWRASTFSRRGGAGLALAVLVAGLLVPVRPITVHAAVGGNIATIVGTGVAGFSGDGSSATQAELNGPTGLAYNANDGIPADNLLYIADTNNNRIRAVNASGTINTFAGTGSSSGPPGDGGPATSASLNHPTSVAVDPQNNVYIADTGNNRIRKVDPSTGNITTILGGTINPAPSAPRGLFWDWYSHTLMIADTGNNKVLAWDPATLATTVFAGTGSAGYSGDSGQATAAQLSGPTSIGRGLGGPGSVIIADTGNNRLRAVDWFSRVITTLAGGGTSLGDLGPPSSAQLSSPGGLATNPNIPILVTDTGANRIRFVNQGTITTIVGTGTAGYGGDGGLATSAMLNHPSATIQNGQYGNELLISDTGNNRIRQVDFPGPAPAPTNVVAVAGDSSVSLSWTPPADDGGTPIIGYRVQRDGGWDTYLYGLVTHTVITGLTNGQSHTFSVTSLNWNTIGGGANSNTVTPMGSASCPGSWGIISSPNAYANNELNAVAAISPTDIWAVGDNNATTVAGMTQDVRVTLAEHWDGTAWSIVSSPDTNAGTGDNILTSVAAVSTADAWAVGLSQPDPTSARSTLAEHWNGTNWSIVTSPNVPGYSNSLFSVKGDSASDYWAVGESHISTSDRALAEHWNGTSWTVSTTPSPSTYTIPIAVKVLSPANVWAVGEQSADGNIWTTLIEHWNGSVWSVVPSPQSSVGNGFLLGIDGTANDLWAVGAGTSNGSDFTLIEHWDGLSWTAVSNPPTAGNTDLISIAAVSSTNVWAVGTTYGGTSVSPTDHTFVVHWDGTTWNAVAAVDTATSTDLIDVAALGSDIWTVGAYLNAGNTAQTLTENFCAPPVITGISPASGPTAGGTSVTISGSGLALTTGVDFGTTPASSFTVNSDTQVTAVSPAGAAGTTDVRIAYFGGLSPFSAGDQFTYNPTVPGAPTAVTATGGNASATVSWTAPASNGGAAITAYVITPYIGSSAQTPTTITGSPPATTTVITGLTNGTTYTFKVTAQNSAGAGPQSAASNPVTPSTVPGAPTQVNGLAGDNEATITWTPPASNGGSAITSYLVTASPGGATVTVSAVVPAATITGLTNGTAYTFTVAAINAVGTGAASGASAALTPAVVAKFGVVAVLPAMSSGAYGGYLTVAYLENFNPTAAHIRVQYFDQSGNPVGAGNSAAGLPFWGTWTLRQDNADGLAAGQAGSAVVYSDQPLALFVNEFAPNNTGDATSYSSIKMPAGAGTTVYAPAIANNAYGGYTTGIGLINTGSAATDVRITYRDGSGATVKVQNLTAVAANAYQGLYSGDAALGLPAGFAGTATIESTSLPAEPLAAVINEVGPGGQFSSYDAVPAGNTTVQAPVALNNAFGGYFTGMGIQNTGATAGTVTLTYYDGSGTLVKTVSNQAISANGYLGIYQGDPTLGPPASASGYTAVLTATVPIAAIVNEVAPSTTSAMQSTAYNTFGGGSASLNLPLVESAGADGWSTGEGIMNTGATATTVTVTYFDTVTGAPIGTPQSQLLQPNAFWGLYQPAGGLPSGTRASAQVTTTGQPVAVICNESNATTFMSYSGQ